jgi:hypothetical protein
MLVVGVVDADVGCLWVGFGMGCCEGFMGVFVEVLEEGS